jgi:hypothetical protein
MEKRKIDKIQFDWSDPIQLLHKARVQYRILLRHKYLSGLSCIQGQVLKLC